MNPQDVVDLSRQALLVALLVSSPVLVTGLVVGLIVGLLQALTQIQEQTVAFVPKLVAMGIALLVSLPWVLTIFLEYVQGLFTSIPDLI